MDKLKRKASGLLKKFYGYSSFLPLQYEVIKCVMEGNDAVVLMPTGGGKSICFQIPTLLMEGCTIVVSPLLALMKDQVDTLQSHGIPAAAINSNQSEQFNREVAEQVFCRTNKTAVHFSRKIACRTRFMVCKHEDKPHRH